MLSLLSRRTQATSHTLGLVRHYAAKNEGTGDPKLNILRRTLWPPNLKTRPAPNGGWRPDVAQALQFAIPSVQAHQTIERAWKLFQRHQRKKREAETARKFECMKNAMDELHRLDLNKYMAANRPEDPRAHSDLERRHMRHMKGADLRAMEARVRGLFPREFKVPSDTPSRKGWNYDWSPFPRPM